VTALITIGCVAVAWLLLSPRVSPWLYRTCLFKPGKELGDKNELLNLAAQHNGCEAWFSSKNGHRLHAWTFGDLNTPGPLLVYSMGRDGDIARRARILSLLLREGLPVFVYEYSGYGASEGTPSVPQVCSDAQAAIEYVTTTLKKPLESVVIYGESLGSAIVASLLHQYQPAGIVFKSGFASLRQIAKELFFPVRMYPKALFGSSDMDTCEALSQSACPVLIAHGVGDRLARWHHARQLYAAAREPKKLLPLPDSRHAFTTPADEELLIRETVAFVRECVKQAVAAKSVAKTA
jgi:alpha-beta hydrolase superfamily lysophospholipase